MGLKLFRGLHIDPKGNLYAIGRNDRATHYFIVKYNQELLAAPFITSISDHCSDDPSAKAKLNNPPGTGTISITLDGFPLPYNRADSTFQYFTKGTTGQGRHNIIVKYINGNSILSDSVYYQVTFNLQPVALITTEDLLYVPIHFLQ